MRVPCDCCCCCQAGNMAVTRPCYWMLLGGSGTAGDSLLLTNCPNKCFVRVWKQQRDEQHLLESSTFEWGQMTVKQPCNAKSAKCDSFFRIVVSSCVSGQQTFPWPCKHERGTCSERAGCVDDEGTKWRVRAQVGGPGTCYQQILLVPVDPGRRRPTAASCHWLKSQG